MRIPVAVVGCGYWGPNLVRNFLVSPRYTVARVIDRDPARLQGIRSAFPSVPVSTDFADALAEDVRLVVLATPPQTHLDLGLRALAAGKHLLVEKPMALSSADCAALNAAAASRGLVLLVDHTFLFTPAVRWIKAYLDSGELGELRYIDSTRINLGLFQEQVNVLWDLAPHDFSIVDHLLGRPPVTVNALGAGHLDQSRENLAYAALAYPGGILCHFTFNWLSPVKVRRIILGGSKRMVLFDDTEPTEKIRVYDHGVERKADSARHSLLVDYRTGDILIPKLPQEEALANLAEHAYAVISGGAPTRVGGADGERVVRMVEAAQASMAARGAPVDMA